MASIGMNRFADGVLTSADTAILQIVDSTGVSVVGPITVVATSAGIYSYDVSTLVVGAYTATWQFTDTGQADEFVSRPFSIDSPTVTYQGVTLMSLERAVARAVGPFHLLSATSTLSTINQAIITKLKSSMDIGDYEDLFMLRRGLYRQGGLVTNFATSDRQRIVDTYDHTLGALEPDAAWTIAPAETEAIELHTLDPEEELREAVIEGLSRCYFWDTAQISTPINQREVNLTALVPWITRKEQVRLVEYGRVSYLPNRPVWFDTYQSGPNIILQTTVPNVGSLRVHALRAHSTLVNGEYSGSGPDSDLDLLNVDKRFARLAGHLACWENYPDKLADLAVAGRRPSQQDVADAFTRRSMAIAQAFPEFVQNRFREEDNLENLQIGNL